MYAWADLKRISPIRSNLKGSVLTYSAAPPKAGVTGIALNRPFGRRDVACRVKPVRFWIHFRVMAYLPAWRMDFLRDKERLPEPTIDWR